MCWTQMRRPAKEQQPPGVVPGANQIITSSGQSGPEGRPHPLCARRHASVALAGRFKLTHYPRVNDVYHMPGQRKAPPERLTQAVRGVLCLFPG